MMWVYLLVILSLVYFFSQNNYVVNLEPPSIEYINNMGGIPPGVSPEKYLSAGGKMEVSPIIGGHRIRFKFWNLIPDGFYTFWNVLSEKPVFKDEPLGKSYIIVADKEGNAEADIVVDSKLGTRFLLDYHFDRKPGGVKGKTKFGASLSGFFR